MVEPEKASQLRHIHPRVHQISVVNKLHRKVKICLVFRKRLIVHYSEKMDVRPEFKLIFFWSPDCHSSLY